MHDKIMKIIDEIHTMVLNHWSDSDLNEFFLGPYSGNSFVYDNCEFGRWIRNRYSLWTVPWEPELRDGIDYSPYHPDAISMTIIKEVWKKGRP